MTIENHPYYNYYKTSNKKYSGKVFALYHDLNSSEKDLLWCLPNFEDQFEKIDLLKEPNESLQDLYLKRAIELRNEYDYLILNYSGGPDSHNILETFMLNGIFLDEIFIYSCFDENTVARFQKYDHETFMMHPEFYEAERSALPLAKYFVENHSPLTKITYVNNFHELHKKYWINQNKKSFTDSLNGNANVMLTHRHMSRSVDPNFSKNWKNIKEKKKTAHIWGLEKPKLSYDSVGIFFSLTDQVVRSRIDLQHILTHENIPNNHELFYIHSNTAKMYLKQAHVIMNSFDKDAFLNPSKNYISTRKNENFMAQVIYDQKIKIPYYGLKLSDLLSKYKEFSFLRKMSETGIIPGYADMTETINMKLYFDNPNDDASKKYDEFVQFIHQNFFVKFISQKEMLYKLALGTSSKKHYIKYF